MHGFYVRDQTRPFKGGPHLSTFRDIVLFFFVAVVDHIVDDDKHIHTHSKKKAQTCIVKGKSSYCQRDERETPENSQTIKQENGEREVADKVKSIRSKLRTIGNVLRKQIICAHYPYNTCTLIKKGYLPTNLF